MLFEQEALLRASDFVKPIKKEEADLYESNAAYMGNLRAAHTNKHKRKRTHLHTHTIHTHRKIVKESEGEMKCFK